MRRTPTILAMFGALAGLGFASLGGVSEPANIVQADIEDGNEVLSVAAAVHLAERAFVLDEFELEDGHLSVFLSAQQMVRTGASASIGLEPDGSLTGPDLPRRYSVWITECRPKGCTTESASGSFELLDLGPTAAPDWRFTTSSECGPIDVTWSLDPDLPPEVEPRFNDGLPDWSDLRVNAEIVPNRAASGVICGLRVEEAMGNVSVGGFVEAKHRYTEPS